MSRSKANMNVVYISERIKECLRHISESDITTIIAPMGYGKTTAANWYLNNRSDEGDKVLRISIYSDNRELFWKSFQRVFQSTPVGNQMKEMEFPTTSTALGLLSEFLQGNLSNEKRQYYLFIDDYHLMNDLWIMKLLLILSRSLANLHIVVASREAFLSRSEELQLGHRLHKISINDLRMNPTELLIYSRRCGVSIDSQQITELNKISEGWFAAVYLNLKSFSHNGTFLINSHDIYEMRSDSLLAPLQEKEREFLMKISLADEFTVEQAEVITRFPETEEIVRKLSQSNAFVQLLPDGKTYRLHHMLKECMNKQFEQTPIQMQSELYGRYGVWHESQKEYIQSLNFYMSASNNSDVLRIIGMDAGVQLASMKPEKILLWLEQCTESELIADPCGLLVLMRRLFSWREVQMMMRVKELLLKAAENTLDEAEKNNLLGECDLIMSFLGYNDIVSMSRLHRSACQKMTRRAISIQKHGSWTFGSPSVLMMFHRETGKMNDELQAMQDSMPYYNRVTDNQGIGAEYVMEAEVRYCRGEFVDAHIALEKARLTAKSKEQQYIMLCCDFLSLRMTLCGMFRYDKEWYDKKRNELKRCLDSTLLAVVDGCYAYFCALTQSIESIPEWIANGDLNSTNLLHPARPMYEIIYNQVLLAKGEFARLLGRGEELLKLCGIYPYTLCSLHLHIQQAAAYEALGKRHEAISEFKDALAISVSDGCVMPFVENYHYIKELIPYIQGDYSDFIKRLQKLAGQYIKEKDNIRKYVAKIPAAKNLSETEYRICELIAAHRTNREIAVELFFSEGTVKQYISQIYSKLGIDGDNRDKRKQVKELMSGNN